MIIPDAAFCVVAPTWKHYDHFPEDPVLQMSDDVLDTELVPQDTISETSKIPLGL